MRLLVSVMMLLGAGVPGHDTTAVEQQEVARFQGTWCIISVESGGKYEIEEIAKYTFRFTGKCMIFCEQGNIEGTAKFDLDTAQCPRQITFGGISGIYAFKNGLLHLCYTLDDERPAKLKTSASRPDEVLMILKRISLP